MISSISALQKIITNITNKNINISINISILWGPIGILLGTYFQPPFSTPRPRQRNSPRHRFLGGFGGHANGPCHRRLRDLGDLGLLGGREPLLEISFMDNIINIVETSTSLNIIKHGFRSFFF